MGQVWAQVTSDVIPSKFAGKPPFCAMIINGVEYSYSCENPGCEDALRGYAGQTIMLQAFGSRDAATIQVVQAQGGAPAPAAPAHAPVPNRTPQKPVAPRNTPPSSVRPPAPAPQAPPTRPAQKTQDQALNDAATYVARCGILMQLCHKAAVQTKREYDAEFAALIATGHVPRMEMEQVQASASCLFISAQRAGHADALPTVMPPAQADDDLPM